jgi:hypothetical protein
MYCGKVGAAGSAKYVCNEEDACPECWKLYHQVQGQQELDQLKFLATPEQAKKDPRLKRILGL